MRNFRNIVIIFLIILFLLGICTYVSSIVFIATVWGVDYLSPSIIQPNFSNFPYSLWPTIFDYMLQYINNPEAFRGEGRPEYKLLFAFFTPLLLVFIIFWRMRDTLLDWRPYRQKESVHGDADWASERVIRKAGLRSRKGMLLGRDKKGYLIADGYQHALLFAPTGSGKGVGFVIPNLLYWEDSVIVHDIKLENFELTSGWRKQKLKQDVFCWSPADPDGKSHCYNPLDWVSKKTGQMVDDVQKIASLLMPEQDFWVNEARSLFLGVVLYLLAVPDKAKTFGEVVRTMRSDDVAYNLAVALDTLGGVMHPVGYMNIAAFLQKAEKERSGVVSTMNSSLELWANPLIDTTTASSDFDFKQFKIKPTTVYVGLTPDNLTRLQPLMQVFYQQATEFMCKHMPTPEEKYGVLFMMDEFPTLGKMEQFKTGIAYFRGYKVRLFLIVQDTEQLKGIYEEAGMNSFLSNSTYRVTFAANNMETANLISQLIGNKTVEQESLNKPKFFDLNPGARSLHVSETQRALLLPQEVIMLPRDEQILLIESTAPIKSKKILYYKDRTFTRRLLKPIFIPIQEPFDPKAFANKSKDAMEESNKSSANEGSEGQVKQITQGEEEESVEDIIEEYGSEEDSEEEVSDSGISSDNSDDNVYEYTEESYGSEYNFGSNKRNQETNLEENINEDDEYFDHIVEEDSENNDQNQK
ncbi:type IV secretory system conjugative DNA transfer family protein [Anaplasmataceae bacterium AB001_6]|nr:type IV secretory system conjugative DNA transfer family protein [Anaplasmataceae bacterium AB001_6]